MQKGFMSTGGGLNWFRRRASSSVDFADGIPGTFAWFRWNRVQAYRCIACQLILFCYGRQWQSRARRFEQDPQPDDS